MNDLLYSEIIELFQKAETRKDKIAVLQKYGSFSFQEFVLQNFQYLGTYYKVTLNWVSGLNNHSLN